MQDSHSCDSGSIPGQCSHFRQWKFVKVYDLKGKDEARGHPGLNWGPLDLQSNALPLSYTPWWKRPQMLSCTMVRGYNNRWFLWWSWHNTLLAASWVRKNPKIHRSTTFIIANTCTEALHKKNKSNEIRRIILWKCVISTRERRQSWGVFWKVAIDVIRLQTRSRCCVGIQSHLKKEKSSFFFLCEPLLVTYMFLNHVTEIFFTRTCFANCKKIVERKDCSHSALYIFLWDHLRNIAVSYFFF